MAAGNYEEAKSYYKNAKEISPRSSSPNSKIEEADRKIVEQTKKKEEENKRAEAEKKKSKNAKSTNDKSKKQSNTYTPPPPPTLAESTRKEWARKDAEIGKNQKESIKRTVEIARDLTNTIASFASSVSEENFYEDNAQQVGIELGLDFDYTNFLVHENTVKTINNNGYVTKTEDNTITKAQNKIGMGLKFGLNFHPFITDYFSVGGNMGIALGMHPSMIYGGKISGTTYYSRTETTNFGLYYKFKYGIELAGGWPEFKFLVTWDEIIAQKKFSYIDITELIVSNDKVYNEITQHEINTTYRQVSFGFGGRIMPYNPDYFDHPTVFDIQYVYSPQRAFAWNPKNIAERGNLIPAVHKIKIGIWAQSILKFDFNVGFGQYPISNIKNEYLSNPDSKKVMFEIGIVYNKNWFFGESPW